MTAAAKEVWISPRPRASRASLRWLWNCADDAKTGPNSLWSCRFPRGKRQLQREFGPVFASSAQFQSHCNEAREASGRGEIQTSFAAAVILLWKEQRQRQGENLFLRIPEHALRRPVPRDDATAGVSDDDRVVGGAGDGVETLFAG